MKVAMISPSKSAYSETFIKDQKEALEDILFYYGGEFPKYIEGQGALMSKWRTLIGKLRCVLKLSTLSPYIQVLVKSFKKNNVNLVFAQYGPTGVNMLLPCKILNLPLVVHFHGYDASKHDVISKYKEDYHKLFDYAKRIIVVSKEMEEDLIRLGCNKAKIVYNSCTPNAMFASVTPNYESNNFISIGRFTEKKAPTLVIKAFSKVVKAFPEAKLFMVGDGIKKKESEALISSMALTKNIFILGVKTRDEIIDLMSECFGFVQHSVTASNGDKEGTPVAILEASLAGMPIISTSHAGIKDAVEHNITGVLSEEYDVDEFSKNIIYLLKNKDRAKLMGENGRKYIQKNYSRDVQINKLREVIYLTINNL